MDDFETAYRKAVNTYRQKCDDAGLDYQQMVVKRLKEVGRMRAEMEKENTSYINCEKIVNPYYLPISIVKLDKNDVQKAILNALVIISETNDKILEELKQVRGK